VRRQGCARPASEVCLLEGFVGGCFVPVTVVESLETQKEYKMFILSSFGCLSVKQSYYRSLVSVISGNAGNLHRRPAIRHLWPIYDLQYLVPPRSLGGLLVVSLAFVVEQTPLQGWQVNSQQRKCKGGKAVSILVQYKMDHFDALEGIEGPSEVGFRFLRGRAT
jgi:hypothetical protein